MIWTAFLRNNFKFLYRTTHDNQVSTEIKNNGHTPNVIENLDSRPCQSSESRRSQLACITNTGDVTIAPHPESVSSVQNQVFNEIVYKTIDPFQLFLLPLFLFGSSISSFSSELIDLEKDLLDDFVLETKQINIPGYPDAFNPSIIRWNNNLLLSFRPGEKTAIPSSSLLMSFRIRDPNTGSTNQIGLLWLDEKLNIISEPKILQIPNTTPFASMHQDPRLFTIGDRLFCVFSKMVEGVLVRQTRRMCVAEIFYDGENFSIESVEPFIGFEKENEQRWEKNWVPFVYMNHLLLGYSLTPHRILYPTLEGNGECKTIASTLGKIDWNWGVLRGGTQAFLNDGEYLSFFHSSKNMMTTQSEGKNITHYFMGAYTFSSEPPFSITSISSKPIVGEKFYNGPEHKTWKPLRVVFPGGYIFDSKYIWVAYGRQDHEVWIAKLDKQGLLNSLVPVNQAE